MYLFGNGFRNTLTWLTDSGLTEAPCQGNICRRETLLQIDGRDYWLWIAYEPAIDTCLAMHLSRERTVFVCYHFFKQLRRRYGRKPIFTDGARWYTTRLAVGGSGYAIMSMVLN